MFANRLRKNFKHLSRWARRQGLEAFRVYDRDIPEYPYVVDWYAGRAHVVEFAPRRGVPPERRAEVRSAVPEVLGIDRRSSFFKEHRPHRWGETQYEKLASGSEPFLVREQGLSFWVNLGDYLDTGLFLDHRETRRRVRDEASGKRVLNLFSYTGSFSVYAAAGGAAATTSVDLSNTYCAWAERNLAANGLGGAAHQVLRADVLSWLEEAPARPERFDLIVLDPPSFSTSKKMQRRFELQRDHPWLLSTATALLAPGGALYFSTNFLGFRLDCELPGRTLDELTPRSIPPDFRLREVHRCWRVSSEGR